MTSSFSKGFNRKEGEQGASSDTSPTIRGLMSGRKQFKRFEEASKFKSMQDRVKKEIAIIEKANYIYFIQQNRFSEETRAINHQEQTLHREFSQAISTATIEMQQLLPVKYRQDILDCFYQCEKSILKNEYAEAYANFAVASNVFCDPNDLNTYSKKHNEAYKRANEKLYQLDIYYHNCMSNVHRQYKDLAQQWLQRPKVLEQIIQSLTNTVQESEKDAEIHQNAVSQYQSRLMQKFEHEEIQNIRNQLMQDKKSMDSFVAQEKNDRILKKVPTADTTENIKTFYQNLKSNYQQFIDSNPLTEVASTTVVSSRQDDPQNFPYFKHNKQTLIDYDHIFKRKNMEDMQELANEIFKIFPSPDSDAKR